MIFLSYPNHAEIYSELCQTFKIERFAKIVNGLWPLTIIAKHFIVDVWLGSECAFETMLRLIWIFGQTCHILCWIFQFQQWEFFWPGKFKKEYFDLSPIIVWNIRISTLFLLFALLYKVSQDFHYCFVFWVKLSPGNKV